MGSLQCVLLLDHSIGNIYGCNFLQMRQELERLLEERIRFTHQNAELMKEKTEAEKERKNLRTELKEVKFRETRMLTDYSELEEENITLQKQVSGLKSSQVHFIFVQSYFLLVLLFPR